MDDSYNAISVPVNRVFPLLMRMEFHGSKFTVTNNDEGETIRMETEGEMLVENDGAGIRQRIRCRMTFDPSGRLTGVDLDPSRTNRGNGR